MQKDTGQFQKKLRHNCEILQLSISQCVQFFKQETFITTTITDLREFLQIFSFL